MTPAEYYLELENIYISNIRIASIAASLELGIFDTVLLTKPKLQSFTCSRAKNRNVLSALLESQISLGLIEERNDDLYLTENCKTFFLKNSEFYYGNEIFRKANSEILERLLRSIDSSYSLEYSGQALTDMWTSGSVKKETAEKFTTLMHTMMSYPAYFHCYQNKAAIINETQIVDVGGGSGVWAKNLKGSNPAMEVTIFDLPEVIEAAKRLIPLNIQSEIKFVPGSFFKQIPSSNSYLLSNILHDWPESICSEILKNISHSIKDNGSVYIHECLLNESRTQPVFTSLFNLLMAINHNSQQFSFLSLLKLMKNEGFEYDSTISEFAYYKLLKFKQVAR